MGDDLNTNLSTSTDEIPTTTTVSYRFHKILKSAKPGELKVLYYGGHGSRRPVVTNTNSTNFIEGMSLVDLCLSSDFSVIFFYLCFSILLTHLFFESPHMLQQDKSLSMSLDEPFSLLLSVATHLSLLKEQTSKSVLVIA
jgi:hypothetical protein